MTTLSSLIGTDRAGLAEALAAASVPERSRRMRAAQLWHWIYHRGATSFEVMSTLPADLRAALASSWTLDRPKVVADRTSADGTRKWLLSYHGGHEVEAVFIPEEDRGALCISTQVGCSLTCSFCHTGTMPLVRNLKAEEIVAQIMTARDALGEWPTAKERRLTHIVVMGMGEPLLNYDATVRALRIAMDGDGLAFSRRKITLSTSGVAPRIEACGHDLGIRLAISLHAVRDDVRDQLVPINRRWNIAALLQACRTYPKLDRPITFEYVMLDRINDSDADARELVRLIRGIPAKVNLIPFNPWPDAPYRCSSTTRIRAFAELVARAGYPSPVRTPRGQDILAACGQLKTETERARRRVRPLAA